MVYSKRCLTGQVLTNEPVPAASTVIMISFPSNDTPTFDGHSGVDLSSLSLLYRLLVLIMTARPRAKRLAELPAWPYSYSCRSRTYVWSDRNRKAALIAKLPGLTLILTSDRNWGPFHDSTLFQIRCFQNLKLDYNFDFAVYSEGAGLERVTAWLSSSLLTWLDWLLDYPAHYWLIRVLTGQTAFPQLIPGMTPRVQYYSWLVYMIGNVLCLTCAYTSLQSTWVLEWHDYLSSACQLFKSNSVWADT